jgi:hypothetical protein
VKELIHIKNNNNDVMIIHKKTTAFITPTKEYFAIQISIAQYSKLELILQDKLGIHVHL